MSLLLAVTLAAAIQPACSWDNPGHNPYTGGNAAAIDRYTDIPEPVRRTLKRRMEEGLSDDKVDITRDHITGKYKYDSAIRDMHFGRASVCATVTRNKWAESRTEPAAVYCVGQHCILVPRICGNVSRVNRSAATAAAQPPAAKQQASDSPAEFVDITLLDAPTPDDADELGRPALVKRLLAGSGQPLIEERMTGDLTGGPDHNGTHADGALLPAAPVPEADTWAMLLAGFGLVGWQARRRARKQAADAAK